MISVQLAAEILTKVEVEGERCMLNITYDTGTFGTGSGAALVQLTALNGNATQLTWRARAAPTGKLAQLGNRLIEASTQKIAADFFSRFNAALNRPVQTKSFLSRIYAFFSQRSK